MSNEIKRIGVFSSGGDAPGMNAAIRAVVRTASYYDLHVYGIYQGYEGMIEGKIKRIETRDVGNIIHRGGTILKTARSEKFKTKEGRQAAFESLQAFNIDGLVAIGGDGTYTGAKIFGEEFGIPIIGVPGTIDNDLYGTDYTIGYDTAINTAIEAVDKIRDTADSHNRLFFVEVMGRDTGFIALSTGIGSGAGSIFLPELKGEMDSLFEVLKKSYKRNKLFNIIIVAEGDNNGGATEVAKAVKEKFPDFDARVTIIGHLQRGGSPTCRDRVLASILGASAVEGLLNGHKAEAVGIVNHEIVYTPFEEAITKHKELSKDLIRLAPILAL
ncbi:MAG: 6-phosphofructokinase [Saprospiraceae bacterium]|nr:6-phosphofructokinase [Saprospiraceae bacterium]